MVFIWLHILTYMLKPYAYGTHKLHSFIIMSFIIQEYGKGREYGHLCYSDFSQHHSCFFRIFQWLNWIRHLLKKISRYYMSA